MVLDGSGVPGGIFIQGVGGFVIEARGWHGGVFVCCCVC